MRFAGWLAALALVSGAPARALAHGEAGAQLPPDPAAVTKDGEKAKAELARVAAAVAAKEMVEPALTNGKKALGRAHGAHLAGDAQGGSLLSRVALAWAQAAAAGLRAFELEAKADKTEQRSVELKSEIERKKGLYVELEARKLSLLSELAKLEQKAAATPAEPAKKPPPAAPKGQAPAKKANP